MSNPGVEELRDESRYTLLASLSHDDIVPFIQKAMRETSIVSIGYYVLVGLTAALTGATWVGTPFMDGLSLFGLGVILGYLLIVLHENIHGLAYRILGARDIRIIYRWRRFTAYCIAPDFVVARGGFTFLALLPFLVITAGALLCFVLFPQAALVWCGILFFHTAACSGDFALVNYFWKRRTQSLYTYDDAAQGLTYFFAARPVASPSGTVPNPG